MKKRNFTSILLASLFAVLLCVPAMAADSTSAASSAAKAPTCVWGTLTKQADGGLLIQNDSEGAAYPEIILHGESILFLDAVTGEEISLDAIRDGSTVYAYIGSTVTASLPPHATAYLILANLPEDFGAPQYVQISSVEAAAEGENTEAVLTQVDFTTTSGTTLTATGDTTLSRFQSEDAVQLEDLVPGTWLLVWSNGEGTPERVMVFDYTYRGYIACDDTGFVTVNGTPLSQQAKAAGDTLALLPVRAVAEALDLTVSWENRQAVVSDGETTLLTVAPDAAGDICMLEDGTLYLDASTLARELNLFQAG